MTPLQSHLEAVERDFKLTQSLAAPILKTEFGIADPSHQPEIVGEMLLRAPNIASEAALAAGVGNHEAANEIVRNGLATLKAVAPEWWINPSRKYYCKLAMVANGGSGNWRAAGESLRAAADRSPCEWLRKDARAWGRMILDRGEALPVDDTDAGLAQESPGLEHVRHSKAHPQRFVGEQPAGIAGDPRQPPPQE